MHWYGTVVAKLRFRLGMLPVRAEGIAFTYLIFLQSVHDVNGEVKEREAYIWGRNCHGRVVLLNLILFRSPRFSNGMQSADIGRCL
jgi:hypothetical protein